MFLSDRIKKIFILNLKNVHTFKQNTKITSLPYEQQKMCNKKLYFLVDIVRFHRCAQSFPL